MSEQPQSPSDAVQTRLITKAWKDEAFKKALLSDPRAAIEKELGVQIWEDINIQVHEQTADTIHLILPPKPEEGELSDEDLEAAAGGYSLQREPSGRWSLYSNPWASLTSSFVNEQNTIGLW